jgi:hypothetical protein
VPATAFAEPERWLEGPAEEALELQKPLPQDAIIMDPSLEKKAAWRAPIRAGCVP